jgi:uncharacterized membrane protein YfcA
MSPYLYSLSGLFVGIVVGMTGVGGGSLMTPLLVLIFGVSPVSAVGTDLLYASITKSVGSVIHGRNRTILWRIAGLLMAGSLPAAIASVLVIRWLDRPHGQIDTLISKSLGVCLLLTALTIIFRPWILRLAAGGRTEMSARTQTILTVVMGVVLGVIVTFSSVGAGALGVTALILLYPRVPVASIVGTDIVHAVPLTLIAGLAHAATGTVNWSVLGWLLIGSIPGIILGSLMTPKADERILRGALAAVLVVVGGRLAFV